MTEIRTLQELADIINECDGFPFVEVNQAIYDNGWVNDCFTEWGICHNDKEKLVFNEELKAVVITL